MQKDYKSFTKEFLKNEFCTAKSTFHFTQEQMAERMRLSTRQCSNLANGKSGFGMESVICFLAFLPEEYILTVLRNYRKLLVEKEENEFTTRRDKE